LIECPVNKTMQPSHPFASDAASFSRPSEGRNHSGKGADEQTPWQSAPRPRRWPTKRFCGLPVGDPPTPTLMAFPSLRFAKTVLA
jgi:hypothetical protein